MAGAGALVTDLLRFESYRAGRRVYDGVALGLERQRECTVPSNASASRYIWLNAAVLLNGFDAAQLQMNPPLWSLSCEWFYYIAALAAVLILRRQFSAKPMLVIGYATALLILAVLMNHKAIILALVWIFGAIAKIVFDSEMLEHSALKWASIALVLVLLILAPLGHKTPDLVLGAAVAFMIAHRSWAEWRVGDALGQRLAGFSYSLYLIHHPITLLVLGVGYHLSYLGMGTGRGLPLTAVGLSVAVATLFFAVGFAWVFSMLTEAQTGKIRRLLEGNAPACL